MSQESSPKNDSPLHQPPPTLWQLCPAALRWALIAALVVTVVYVLWILLISIAKDWGAPFVANMLFVNALQVFVLSFALSFPLRLIFTHRKIADRTFTIVGFLATFFGLAMLVVFFCSLIWNSVLWFHYTPQFIAEYNKQLKAKIALAKNTDKYIENRLNETTYKQRKQKLRQLQAKLKRDLKRAGDNEEKKTALHNAYEEEKDIMLGLYEELLPGKKAELKKEAVLIAETYPKFIREDTSAAGVFWHFITAGPSNEPQNAGIWFAILGSLWVSLITMFFSVPVGVGAALYLEEYRSHQQQRGWLGNLIQININNLAGIPSVVYGVLGAFVFVELVFKPIHLHVDSRIATRNLLGGGLTLGLLTLPIVIVSAQEAIRAVPQSIRHGAYALGATRWQVIWRNVLPMANPGILTGTILSVSRAIGEAAPMVLFGAMLYVDQRPGLFSRFTILPMQIFNWALEKPWELVEGSGEYHPLPRYNAALASLILILILLGLNAAAIIMRNRAQRSMRE